VEPGTPPGFLYQQSTLRDALAAGLTLNILNRHCERVAMANIAQTVNVLQALVLVDGNRLVLTPTYHVYEMYQVHQGATLLPAEIECAPYQFGGESMPAVSLSASRDAAGKVYLSLCNLNPGQDLELSCELRGMEPRGAAGRLLTAEAINAHNTSANPEAVAPVAFDDWALAGSDLRVKLPAKSVLVIEIQ
jgi:alpha-N-arabinofuranosidase